MTDQFQKKKGFFKSVLPTTLFGRSLLILVLPVLLIQALSTFIFFDRHWIKMTSRLAFAVAGEISILANLIESTDDQNEIQEFLSLAETRLDYVLSLDPQEKLVITDVNKYAFFHGFEGMIHRTLRAEMQNALTHPFEINVDFYEKWIEVRVQLSKGVLNISLPQRRLFSSTTYIFLIWIFCASSLLLVISILFMRNQIRPIRRLAIAAERFGKGRDVRKFKIEGAKEVRQAGQAFLDMKTRIQRQIKQRTEMLAGVSHDLRTPLTRLKLQVAMMGDSPDVYDMKNDIRDMERMIDGYLDFVRGEGDESPVMTDIAVLLQDVTTSVKRQGIDVLLNLNDISVFIALRRTAFKRCLNNITSNAAKYGSMIWITLNKVQDNQIEIVFEDNGPGIPEEKMSDVFRPFYRVDSSRNTETGGVGLGLPISMDIVHTHGGEIWLEKSQHGGLAVYIRLPV
ncbi:MAG: HAMP domain-containing protein [Alphaproteobacteria bacterium]|nr:HAMP domain-containing protein [Alphaproteobacteria bacterium]